MAIPNPEVNSKFRTESKAQESKIEPKILKPTEVYETIELALMECNFKVFSTATISLLGTIIRYTEEQESKGYHIYYKNGTITYRNQRGRRCYIYNTAESTG